MIDKNTIINELHRVLEPLPFIRAFWLEGADAAGYADEYSDIDFWVDCEDAQEEEAIAVVEGALARLSTIDYRYICHHSHPKIRQRIYHLAGTGEYLMIDFCWQLHSRPREEYGWYENDPVEAVKVIFDRDQIIRYRPMDPADYVEGNRIRLQEACYRRSQYCRVVKYIRRGQYPEAYAYYNRYVLEPLIDLLRLIHTPAYSDYYLIHISRHIPEKERKRLEYFLQTASLTDMEKKIPQAGAWFDELLCRVSV